MTPDEIYEIYRRLARPRPVVSECRVGLGARRLLMRSDLFHPPSQRFAEWGQRIDDYFGVPIRIDPGLSDFGIELISAGDGKTVIVSGVVHEADGKTVIVSGVVYEAQG